MTKPAFIFDGRNILDHAKLREIGFIVYALGKPLVGGLALSDGWRLGLLAGEDSNSACFSAVWQAEV